MIYLRHFLTFLLLFAFTSISAQSVNKMLYTDANNVGYFDFGFTNPTSNTIAGSTVATNSEGITHVQNTLGTVIFYVKSDGIYNSNGTLMTGSPTMGDADITEVNVCQIPGSPNQYYVFYTQASGCSNLYFSKVDVSGATGVVFGANTLLGDTTNAGGNYAEGKEIVEVPNSTKKWLIVYNCDFGFEKFEITQTNVNGPVGVKAWTPATTNPALVGKGELDYHAEYIAYASAHSDHIYVFGFNPCIGKAEGTTRVYDYESPYGIEFSPSAFYIYGTTSDPAGVATPNTNLVRIQNTPTATLEYYNITGASDCSANDTLVDVTLGQIELAGNSKMYTPGVNSCTMFELDDLENPVFTVEKRSVNNPLNRGLSDIVQSSAFLTFINLDVDINHITCNGGADGSISLSISGGIPPYEVEWYDGSNLYNKTNLVSGSYLVTIKDQSCGEPSVTRNIFIAEPDTIAIEIQTEDAICYSGFGDLEYTVVGGTPPYTEVWPVGFDKNNPVAGDHSLVIVDFNGCTAIKDFFIDSPDEIKWTDSIIHATCYDGYGRVYMNELEGGVRPYVINGNSDTILDFKAGTHNIQLIDRNGCIINRSITINEPDEILIDIELEQDDCNTFLSRGTAEATGGSGELTIEWLGIDKDNIPPGKYAVRAVDTNGCEGYQIFSFVPEETTLKVPTVFTPNGDGVNEYFQPVLDCYRSFSFEVYSRWGEEVFVSTPERDKWFGFDKSGKQLPSDVYVYILEYIDSEGFKRHKEGAVMLTY